MAWRVSASHLRALCLLALGTGGCVEDVQTQGDVPANHGATQPSTSGQSIPADEACSRLEDAERAARRELDCETGSLPGCPERLRLVGSLVCSAIDEGSVDECVSAIGDYRTCAEFESRPCVVTVVRDTCVNPYEAGAPPPQEAGPPSDSSVADGMGGPQPEGSVPPPPQEAGPLPPDPPVDAGPVPTDAPTG